MYAMSVGGGRGESSNTFCAILRYVTAVQSGSCQRFGGTYCLPEDEGRKFFRNVRFQASLQKRTVSQPTNSNRGTGGLRGDVKFTYSPQCSVQVKNAWKYASSPPYVFSVCSLVKHRNDFMT
jgi:hypothetical protein